MHALHEDPIQIGMCIPTIDGGYTLILHPQLLDEYLNANGILVIFKYRTRAILTRGLYTFYPLFKVHLFTVTFGLIYG